MQQPRWSIPRKFSAYRSYRTTSLRKFCSQAKSLSIFQRRRESAMASLIRRVAIRNVSPRSTGPQDPQNPVQDGTPILPWTTPPVSTRSRFREQGIENFPLGIGQVSIMDGHSGHRLGLTTLRKSAVMTPLSEDANLLINFGARQSIPITVNSSRD